MNLSATGLFMAMQSIGQNRKLLFFNDLYPSPNVVRVIKSRRMRWAGHGARMGRGEVYTGFGGKTYGKEPLGKPSRSWEDNNKTVLQEVGCRDMD